MSTITRRSLILSGAGLATAAFVVPAEAATHQEGHRQREEAEVEECNRELSCVLRKTAPTEPVGALF